MSPRPVPAPCTPVRVTRCIKVAPRPGLTVSFGRGEEPDVDLGLGMDDLRVSRRHGESAYRGRQCNLLKDLVESATLVPPDLDLLEKD
ncbi:hypothetical protein [Streptomyces sp. MMG1121]|uniref:hypothetical protein n=1 Tax=Streptomyces sp. MMG1121 TaxID=1415544 RepID=UPI0006AFC745|nr:hypothetical protein [Streptomyces sp. MMG1121]KOV67559.1 hypothetical protein ADK64_09475 [Streptomyces sp. MMG1121]